jgi:hypothetical protein
MQTPRPNLSRLLETIADHLDVPPSYYEKAAARHRNLGEWLHREESKVVDFAPDVRPQGSFRYGTVIRPIRPGEKYDLDNVCLLRNLGKAAITQAELKAVFGEEIKAYAKAHGMLAPVTEHNRCWRLRYADEAEFHLDTLPCVPEDETVVAKIIAMSVPQELACRMVAITDRRHPHYRQISSAWLSSNPRGFARWFEQKAALGRARALVEGRLKAAVEDVPPYEWKTPLQRSIQILKRHRDVMFYDNKDLAPISMIITNLAARAYEGETDLGLSIMSIVEKMPNFVRSVSPYVPNPADPAEDYADKWRKDPELERNFWLWHNAVSADLGKLPSLLESSRLDREVSAIFRVDLTRDELESLKPKRENSVPAVVKPTPTLIISSAPRPWGKEW